jgi:hypothetical protein
LDAIFVIIHLLNSVLIYTCLSLSIVDDFLENEIIYVLHAQDLLLCFVITLID